MFTLNDEQIDADILRLVEVFEDAGFEIRIVGGAVRDYLMGSAPKDVDLCTNATPQEMIDVARDNQIHYLPTGLQHGTITLMMESGGYEITTLRIDVETDGRHAQVEFTRDFQQDAARRDFTINAMSMNPRTGEVFDYFGGQEDLKYLRVRFVGNPEDRIREDYLRVLRYFRFIAKMNTPIVDRTMMPLFSSAWVHEGLETISGERIWSEMKKILDYPSAPWIFEAMVTSGMMPAISNIGSTYNHVGAAEDHALNTIPLLKKFCANRFEFRGELERSGLTELSKVGALAILGQYDYLLSAQGITWQETIGRVDERLKLSAEERKAVEFTWERSRLFGPDGFGGVGRNIGTTISNWVRWNRILGSNGRSAVVDRLIYAKGKGPYDPFDEVLADTKVFEVSGKDLMALGYKPGPQMGLLLTILKTLQIDGPKPWSKEDLLNWLNDHVVDPKTVHVIYFDTLIPQRVVRDMNEYAVQHGLRFASKAILTSMEKPYGCAIICPSEEAAMMLKLRMDM